MEFKGMDTIVIDVLRTPELQRLRRIHQMGLGYFVFPGAEHSRFVHSLGSSYIAIKFGRRVKEVAPEFLIKSLCPSDNAIRDLAVAALCHDLGHGPLSHAWEREIIGKHFNFNEWSKSLGVDDERDQLEGAKWHELVTYSLLKWEDGRLHKLLEQDDADSSIRLRKMLRGTYYITYLPRLLASDIDADRSDFLRRDSFQCGVDYGRYDIDRLLSTITVGEATNNKLVVGFQEPKALRAVEQYLRARRDLYEIVYYHKTVRCAEGMVALFLRRLKHLLSEGHEFHVTSLVQPLIKVISGGFLCPHEVLALDDYSLWVLIENITRIEKADSTVVDLGKRILERDFFKIVPCNQDEIAEFLQEDGAYDKLREAIKPFCPGDEEFYYVKDDTEFNVFCDEENEFGYFVNSENKATPFCQHPELRDLSHDKKKGIRLYTLREAVDSVFSIIKKS
jgi:HD superfamily phosphohydrolase